jgi:serine protease Do
MANGSRIRVLLYCLLAGLVGVIVGSRAWVNYTRPPDVAAAPAASGAPATSAAGVQATFAPIVDKALPAVVNVSAARVIRNTGGQMSPFFMDPFFRQFFGDDFGRQGRGPSTQKQRGLGSGVIVRPDGYVLTNNHVIDGATDISVTLLDKREFKAKVVGADPRTDLAVLKIDAKDLPVLAFGDSSKVRVGDLVLAMGEPFGIGQSVTMGIISAKGRSNISEIGGYQDFIQTDAAINQGNSGGALVDVHGDLIGINTAILTHGGGGNEGVGFAIPANMAHSVMEQIVSKGKVVRGQMGVFPQDITPGMAESLHLTDTRGVLLGDVTPGTPAAKAGLQRGDVLLEINGERIDSANQLRARVSLMAPGTAVRVKYLRDGSQHETTVTLAEATPEQAQNRAPSYGRGRDYNQSSGLSGVTVQDLDPDTLRQLRLPPSTRGVVVANVDPASAAAEAGLQPGDVILEVDRTRIASTNDFDRAVRRAPGHTLLLLLDRQNITMYLPVEPR